jgi:molybdopterin-guanine dinucleotide biosynthesis protein A
MIDDSVPGAPVLAGLVLAGGRSSRFGSDKGAAKIAGVALLDRSVALLATVVAPVYVAVRADQVDDPLRRRHELIVDQHVDMGPASALLSAHGRFPERGWFVIACDMPRLTAEALRRLREARDARAAATVYRSAVSGNPEPLCAIYEPATLAAFRRLVLSGGNPSPLAFLVSLLAQNDLKLLQPDSPGLLTNVNTSAEFERIDAGRGEAGSGPAAG